MKYILLGLILSALIAPQITLASDINIIGLNVDHAALFKRGKIARESHLETRAYVWAGGKFELTAEYEVSVINENVACYRFLRYPEGIHGFRAGLQNISVPSYFCNARIDLEVREPRQKD